MWSACGGPATRSEPTFSARNLLLITIDTLRADHVGAYGYARAHTPVLDSLARAGILFERAYAAAPITLPSHATMMTGRYPPGHGSRDNGIRVVDGVPTLATALKAQGFRTGAFVAAFPLDHQFGLDRGFDVYSDRLGRDATGKPANERPASQVVDEAIAWLRSLASLPAPLAVAAPPDPPALPVPPAGRFFLWVHLFDPHAPYGDRSDRRPVLERYDEEIATTDREIGRLLEVLGPMRMETLIVVAGDHGEAFGEHGEYAHSVFVYDTTLRVPLIVAAPGVHRSVPDAVTLADIAPTAARQLGITMKDVDGVDLSPAFGGSALPTRELYAESFAPLIEFGWAPLRSIRSGTWKYVAAPRPELFDVEKDSAEQSNVVASQEALARTLDQRANRYSTAAQPSSAAEPQAAERLRALGYSTGSAVRNPQSAMDRPDPKDRRELAARFAQVMSGELEGAALLSALEGIVREDPRNGQAHLRLGYALIQLDDCKRAEAEFHAAVAAGLPSADIYLGLATCLGQRNDLPGAERALLEARRLEPDNPVIVANVGILQARKGDLSAATESLKAALTADPNLHQARFNLAITYAKAGRRRDAAGTARDLLARLPANAPQRPEVERLLRAVR